MTKKRSDEILDALKDALREVGLNKLTLSDVGDRLGVSKSAIYHYFKNKDQMIRSLLIREFGRIHAEMEQAAGRVSDPAAKMEAIFKARMTYHIRQSKTATWSMDNLLSMIPLARELQANFRESERDLFASILRQGCTSGVFDVQDVELTAGILVSALHSAEESLVMQRNQNRMRKTHEAIVQLWLRGLLSR